MLDEFALLDFSNGISPEKRSPRRRFDFIDLVDKSPTGSSLVSGWSSPSVLPSLSSSLELSLPKDESRALGARTSQPTAVVYLTCQRRLGADTISRVAVGSG